MLLVRASTSRRLTTALASVRVQLPLLIAALLTVVMTVYCIASFREMRSAALERARADVRRVASQLADISAANTRRRARLLRATAQDAAVVRALQDSGDAARADRVLLAAVDGADSTLEGWELWTVDGRRLAVAGNAATGTDSTVLHNVLRGALFVSARAVPAIRSPLYASDDRVHAWLLVPVQGSDGTLGFLAERRRVPNSPAVEGQIRQLMGHDVAVYFTNASHDLWSDVRGRPVSAPIVLGDPRRDPTVASNGTAVIGARAAVRSSPWEIVLTLPEALVVERPARFRRRMALVGLALLILGMAGAWWLSRHVTRPLAALTHAAERIANGDERQRVPVSGGSELAQLATAFNAMAERVVAGHAELVCRASEAAALAHELKTQNRQLEEAWEQALRAVHRTEHIQSATAALTGALDRQTIAAVFTREALAISGASTGAAYWLSADARSLDLEPTSAEPRSDSTGGRIDLERIPRIADSVRRGVASYHRTPIVEDISDGATREPHLQGRASAILPLAAHGRVHGVVVLGFPEPRVFRTGLRSSLEALAAQCGQALERLLAYEEAVNARMAAEAANATRSQFLEMMSHELRTPLNAIGGYTDLMDLGLRGPVTEEQRADFARIQRNKQQLLSIISDLLDHAGLEAGRVQLQLGPVPVYHVLLEAEAQMSPRIAEKGLALDTTECMTDAIVCADREKLCQILVNLLANALRFTDAGGTIRVACETTPSAVRVRVSDTGIGIPPERYDSIFEPFTQLDAGLTRRAGGTGLGLAISRQLAAAMGGTLSVESAVGVGSSFMLTLPALPKRQTPVRAGEPVMRA